MKTFSILLCAGLVVLAGSFSAASAGGRGHGMRKETKQRLGPVFQQLDLSEEQKARFEALRTEFQQEQQAVHEQLKAGTLSREEGRAQLQANAEAHRAALEGILTEEQRQQLAELKQNRQAGPGKGGRGMMGPGRGGPGRMGKGRGGPGLGRMAEALGMTEEQKTQWQELAKAHRAKMEELRQSGQKPDPAAMRQLFAEHLKALEAILTPEQLQKWEEQKKNWKGRHPAPPTEETDSGAATKPAAPAEQTWGQIKSQGK
jgi:Spy/CpxP family protein refolding chaperone